MSSNKDKSAPGRIVMVEAVPAFRGCVCLRKGSVQRLDAEATKYLVEIGVAEPYDFYMKRVADEARAKTSAERKAAEKKAEPKKYPEGPKAGPKPEPKKYPEGPKAPVSPKAKRDPVGPKPSKKKTKPKPEPKGPKAPE